MQNDQITKNKKMIILNFYNSIIKIKFHILTKLIKKIKKFCMLKKMNKF